MAITKTSGDSVAKLKVRTGTSGTGNPIYRTKRFGNVKPLAADDDIYDVTNGIGTLQKYAVNGIFRVDNAQLIEV